MNTNIVYPTEWQYGKPRGVIKENPTNYQLRITVYDKENKPDNKNIYFLFRNYNNKEECYKDCVKKQFEISNNNNLTRNRIRFLDKDTIEVELTQNKYLITDSIFLDKVEKYPVSVKQKADKFYVVCQDKKKTFAFVNLITNSKLYILLKIIIV